MIKRKYIQLLSALIYNANIGGFVRGNIYRGGIKGVCVPGLNCYSCPGAAFSCPLGSLQAALGETKHKMPLYVVGTLLLFGVLLGRSICGFLCPFGLIQELIHKIPSPKLKKSTVTRAASLLKYVILLVFVIAMPLYFLMNTGVSVPAFCKYICPAGTLEAGIPLLLANENLRGITGALFQLKMTVLIAMIVACVFIYRMFCRFLCPLGAIYALFNKYALIGPRLEDKCSGCNACLGFCKMDTQKYNDRECIRCGDCRSHCVKKTGRHTNGSNTTGHSISQRGIQGHRGPGLERQGQDQSANKRENHHHRQ